MSSTIHAEVPGQLWEQVQTLVQQGWAGNVQEIVIDSLRRYLESHQDVLTVTFIQEDVEWGLHGEN